MEVSPGAILVWPTAFLAVFSFYAHTILGLPSAYLTPYIALGIAGLLISMAIFSLGDFALPPAVTPARALSGVAMALAITWFAASTFVAFDGGVMRTNDWGLFAVEAGVPVLLLINQWRAQLLHALGVFCVFFSLLDAAANALAFASIIDLTQYAGRMTDAGLLVRYPGLSGNSHASGLVAFLGASFLAVGIPKRNVPDIAVRLILICGIVGSLWLIDARRYLGLALIAVPLLAVRPLSRIPPILISATVAAVALAWTFTRLFDREEALRAMLMSDGLKKALEHPWVGSGILYKDPSALRPSYSSLSTAGVTESGALDLAVAYGFPAAVFLIVAALLASNARRQHMSWPSAVLTLMTAELAFGGALTGFLGAIVFFGSMIWLQRDESAFAT